MKIQKHRSWKNIIPTHREKKDFGLYSKRILGTFPNTNDNIIKEWFFQQCEIPRVASNYCWIDLSKIVCSERYITVDEVLNIYIPESGIARFNSLKDLKELDITLRKKDKKS